MNNITLGEDGERMGFSVDNLAAWIREENIVTLHYSGLQSPIVIRMDDDVSAKTMMVNIGKVVSSS